MQEILILVIIQTQKFSVMLRKLIIKISGVDMEQLMWSLGDRHAKGFRTRTDNAQQSAQTMVW